MEPIQQVTTEKTIEYRIGLILCIRDQAKFLLHYINFQSENEMQLKEEVEKLNKFIEALKKTL